MDDFLDMEESFVGGLGLGGFVGFDDDVPAASPSPSSSGGGDQSGSDDDELPNNQVYGIPLNGPLRTATASEISAHVSDALLKGKNLLIECPPGLDRRVSILQRTLDYYLHKKGLSSNPSVGESSYLMGPVPSRIYFATQNFQEMERLVADIRRDLTAHMKNLKMAVLGSRKELCINTAVKNQDGINVDKQCKQMIQCYNSNRRSEGQNVRPCPFYQNAVENDTDTLFSFVENQPQLEGFILVRDIEDFVTHGEEYGRCPFFDSRVHHSTADLIICPIEILLSPVLRREYDIRLGKAIVIIDDGHEIEKLSYEEGSLIITDADLRRASSTLRSMTQGYQNLAQQQPGNAGLEMDLAQAMQKFGALVEPLRQLSFWIRDNAKDDLRPSNEMILEQLSNLPVNEGNWNIERLCDAIKRLPTELGITIQDYEAFNNLKKFFAVIFTASNNSRDFLLRVLESEINRDLQQVLKILCSNANLCFGQVEESTLAVIVGGDCLAPIENLKTELGVEFHDVLQVIHDPASNMRDRYFLGYCSKGPNEVPLVLNYETRDDASVKLEVAQAIIQLCKIIPNGVVVVIHSRRYFDMILNFLREAPNPQDGAPTLMAQLEQLKYVIIKHPNSRPEMGERQMEEYRTHSKRGDGALLLVYARDPLYKQYNLKGDELRGIIHVSIPYAEWHHNHTIVAKRKNFDEREVDPSANGNHRWYEGEAYGILNQSFARCVQDQDDWGLIVVLDNRMHSRRQKFHNLIPAWVLALNLLQRYKFGKLLEDAQRFVARMQINLINN